MAVTGGFSSVRPEMNQKQFFSDEALPLGFAARWKHFSEDFSNRVTDIRRREASGDLFANRRQHLCLIPK
jgi:hypothetical protein